MPMGSGQRRQRPPPHLTTCKPTRWDYLPRVKAWCRIGILIAPPSPLWQPSLWGRRPHQGSVVIGTYRTHRMLAYSRWRGPGEKRGGGGWCVTCCAADLHERWNVFILFPMKKGEAGEETYGGITGYGKERKEKKKKPPFNVDVNAQETVISGFLPPNHHFVEPREIRSVQQEKKLKKKKKLSSLAKAFSGPSFHSLEPG
ncbi:hypothetical protein IF1G_01076 [Cordyceps javanica]|uniref:Uncharacterized protein n=1 Tax=Cordyceps javanica TaxID=43265 RepID=A0A545VHE0_9HYPO|nr:hypothetical protein IF1G_01076 [Cordyceps javanica]